MHTNTVLKKGLFSLIAKKISMTIKNMTITDRINPRINKVRQNIQAICDKYHININSLKLLAVSKTHPVSAIQAAFEQGITEFGESYLQEAVEKIQALKHLPICWHFIGPIQSNKTQLIAAHFDWVQSVDREKLLTRLNQQRPVGLKPIKVCIQINFFNEPQKKGVNKDDIARLLELAEQLPNINLRGMMAIPPKTDNFETQLLQFKQIATIFERYQQDFPTMDTLSMGMSNDLAAAIAAGSNMVRIGTALFGKRE